MNELDNEKELIEQAKTDPKAFGDIFDMYYPAIYGYVLKRTTNVQVAEDITSQTFFKALSKLKSFKWKGVSFSSWLYKIAGNEIANHYRGKVKSHISLDEILNKQGFDVKTEKTPEDVLIKQQKLLEDNKVYKEINNNLKTLPLHYQEVLSLRYYEKKKIREIAQIFGKKEGTVKSLLSRGIKLLQDKLNN